MSLAYALNEINDKLDKLLVTKGNAVVVAENKRLRALLARASDRMAENGAPSPALITEIEKELRRRA